jgi:predicted aminopeptidase
MVLMGLLPLLSSCYLLRQGATLVGFHLRAEPIDRLTERGEYRNGDLLEQSTADFLARVEDIRRFAQESLGLEVGRNYTRFVHADRETLAYVVNATGRLSFERTYWSWPFAGSFPYKGFFRPEDARRLARKLEQSEHDVWVRSVDAFSTLGILRDPLYQFMESYDPYNLANLVIHEQTHATLFLRNQTQFNEELATFVGDIGARAYLEQAGFPQETMEEVDDLEHDRIAYRESVAVLRAQLEQLYESDLTHEEKLEEKERVISAYQREFAAEYQERFRTDSFLSFAELPINNAYIDLLASYTQDLSLFEALYESLGRDVAAMMEELAVLAHPREIADRSLRALARSDPKAYIRVTLLDGSVDAR